MPGQNQIENLMERVDFLGAQCKYCLPMQCGTFLETWKALGQKTKPTGSSSRLIFKYVVRLYALAATAFTRLASLLFRLAALFL
jgi:hypothetical protein